MIQIILKILALNLPDVCKIQEYSAGLFFLSLLVVFLQRKVYCLICVAADVREQDSLFFKPQLISFQEIRSI
jgi:hypothetical protein